LGFTAAGEVRMNLMRALALLLTVVGAPATAAERSDEARALADLNDRVLRAYVLEHDIASYDALAHADYKIVVAPGFIESRDQVLSTAGNLSFRRFDVSTRSVDIVGDTGVVIATVEAEGTVLRQPFPPRIVMMNVYVRQNGDWKLLARSMTPMVVSQEVFERVSAKAIGSE
jgi:hypothetical protein